MSAARRAHTLKNREAPRRVQALVHHGNYGTEVRLKVITYPVHAVGVTDGRDGFGLRVGGRGQHRAESRLVAAAHAGVAHVVSARLLVLVRNAPRSDGEVRPLHGVVDTAGKFPIGTPTAFHD